MAAEELQGSRQNEDRAKVPTTDVDVDTLYRSMNFPKQLQTPKNKAGKFGKSINFYKMQCICEL